VEKQTSTIPVFRVVAGFETPEQTQRVLSDIIWEAFNCSAQSLFLQRIEPNGTDKTLDLYVRSLDDPKRLNALQQKLGAVSLTVPSIESAPQPPADRRFFCLRVKGEMLTFALVENELFFSSLPVLQP